MLRSSHFPQFIPPRISETLRRLSDQIWTMSADPLPVAQAEPTRDHISFEEAGKLEFKIVKTLPHYWGVKQYDQCWWRVDLPETGSNQKRYLRWKDQAEATVYVQGIPYYGLDPAHLFCPLPPEASELYIESLCGNVGIVTIDGRQGVDDAGSRFQGAFLATRNDTAWEAYHDLDTLWQLIKYEHRIQHPSARPLTEPWGYRAPMTRLTPEVRRLLRRVNEACDVLDQEGLAAFKQDLARVYEEFRNVQPWAKCILTGHAHLDLVWLWTEKAGEFKAVHTCATQSRIIELYPEMTFGFSQPAAYRGVFRRAPRIEPVIRSRIESGRWEPAGAFEVEADTQLPCGEALARNLVIGQKGFQWLTGNRSPVVWLPDVFGYTGCLPQIIIAAGAKFFFTQKLIWNNATQFPYSSFVWRGNDGSEVLAHVMPTLSYNGQVDVQEVRELSLEQRQSDVHDEFLFPTGYGDGGGGPTETHCERARRLKSLALMPSVQWGRIDDFFHRLNAKRGALPVWKGELYAEFHRGVQTTHGNLKAAFRRCERAIQTWEAARCATGGSPIPEHQWQRLVFAHFHDYIPGTSIQEVCDEGIAELDELSANACEAAARDLESPAGSHALFNPLPHPRNAIIETDGAKSLIRLNPLAGAPVNELPRVDVKIPVEANNEMLSNSRLRAKFNSHGQVTALKVDGHPLAIAAPINQLVLFPDYPSNFHAWEIDRTTICNGSVVENAYRAIVEENSPIRAIVAFQHQVGKKSQVVTRYILEAESPVLKIEFDIEWRDEQALLKAAFPTAYAGSMARFAAPFGSLMRPQQPAGLKQEAMFEVPASRWAVVADDGETDGLCVVTEAKYGFGCEAGLLHVSLVRSAFVSHADINRPLRDVHKETDFSDIGTHTVRLAIGRFHQNLTSEEQPAALADILYTTPISYQGPAADAGFEGIEAAPSLQPAWAVPVDQNRYILRLHETLGRRGRAQLMFNSKCALTPVNLFGEPEGAPIENNNLQYAPYQLISLLVEKL